LRRKTVFFVKRPHFGGFCESKISLMQDGPMPGQKSIRLAKKGGDPSLPKEGFRRFQPSHPFPPASLCGEEAGENWEGLIPAPFCLRRLLFCPGNEKNGLIDKRIWR
jgi:hypothetical protein